MKQKIILITGIMVFGLSACGSHEDEKIIKAVKWLEEAARQENPFADYALGRLYKEGVLLEKVFCSHSRDVFSSIIDYTADSKSSR